MVTGCCFFFSFFLAVQVQNQHLPRELHPKVSVGLFIFPLLSGNNTSAERKTWHAVSRELATTLPFTIKAATLTSIHSSIFNICFSLSSGTIETNGRYYFFCILGRPRNTNAFTTPALFLLIWFDGGLNVLVGIFETFHIMCGGKWQRAQQLGDSVTKGQRPKCAYVLTGSD